VAQGWSTAAQVNLKVVRISAYQLTDKALAVLKAAGVPPDVLKKAASLKDKFPSRSLFLEALSKALTPDELKKFQALFRKDSRISGPTVALIDQDDTTKSTILRHPADHAYDCGCPLWAAVVTDLDGDRDYELQLLEEETTDLLATSVVLFPDAKRLEAVTSAWDGYNTTITSPASNAKVCPSFWASGNTDSSGAVTGQLTRTVGTTGPATIPGTQGTLSNGIWSLYFTGLDATCTYTLTAAVGTDSATPSSTGLTVKQCQTG